MDAPSFCDALTLTTMAHWDAVGRGIHAINKADGKVQKDEVVA
jgi:hypothetical protein|tara:strand:+ start:1736 stop:1864 length:129 start_codon:yes stop_codon:yes gene_type:complete